MFEFITHRKSRKELQKLKDYLAYLNNRSNRFPEGYLEAHKGGIHMIEWLIASYEGRAGDPKEYLEALLDPIKKTPINVIDEMKFLYYWVYYKKITGF